MFRKLFLAAAVAVTPFFVADTAQADFGISSRYRPSYLPSPYRYVPTYRAGSYYRYVPSYRLGTFGPPPVVVPRTPSGFRSTVPLRGYRTPYGFGPRGPGYGYGTRGFSLYIGR